MTRQYFSTSAQGINFERTSFSFSAGPAVGPFASGSPCVDMPSVDEHASFADNKKPGNSILGCAFVPRAQRSAILSVSGPFGTLGPESTAEPHHQ